MNVSSPSLLSHKALVFLESCNYHDRTHEERTALIKVARDIYPNDLPTDEKICMFNTNNTGCMGYIENKCPNYKCSDCYWL